jgi:hypothetical protein
LVIALPAFSIRVMVIVSVCRAFRLIVPQQRHLADHYTGKWMDRCE